ncbi:putative vacuolar protein sorting 11 carboxy-terminal protein [Toxoplasma gondii CAST]|uniref:Putative vacuolar protein sorting 11 carboxy-terminal protein n=1 Tax=Toxoplasma gondii CAST TaxID=943122 RepID=A0A425I7E8_TOXGO|nr:putative vacuolar protein sorting 11 carboxy-terminal protein [Toxoplasma gondii CAST]
MQQLRRLNFFDSLLVQRPSQESKKDFRPPSSSAFSHPQLQPHGATAQPAGPPPLLPPDVVCAAGTPSQLWIGDARGRAHIFTDERFLSPIEIPVFSRGFLSMHAAADAHCIVCVGRDSVEPGASASSLPPRTGQPASSAHAADRAVWKYKSFSTLQVDARGLPVLLREATLFARVPEQVLTCSDINGPFTMLAGGTEAAGVCLFRGDLLRERTCRLRFIKENDLPVTAVRFLAPSASRVSEESEDRRFHLLVATPQGIAVHAVPGKGEPEVTYRDDLAGLPSPLLTAQLLSPNQAAVQQGEGIFCLDARAGNLWALPVDGCCMQLASHKHYLISVSASAEETCSGSPVSAPSQECFLTIFRANPDTRFVAFCCSFPRVAHIVSALDSLYVICRDDGGGSILFELREKGIGDRLNILLRKRLFDWAADIVIQEGQPKSTLQEVYRVHADWLYEKRALDKALRMYIKTIGALEPSYVIEKFLHCQRLWLLALYLLHLHRCGRASQQHTLLFFKCAAKLKDENLFSAFLDDPSISRDAILPAAIQECRANGYLKLASLIARRHGHHDEYVSIFLTDCRNFDEAVAYMKGLDAPSVCSLLLTHGYTLLSHKPRETLALIKNIIFNYQTSADIFIPLFVDNEALMLYFFLSLLYGESYARDFLKTQKQFLSSPEKQALLNASTSSSICAFSALPPAEQFAALYDTLEDAEREGDEKNRKGNREKGERERREEKREDPEKGDNLETLSPHLFGSVSFATFLELLLRFHKKAHAPVDQPREAASSASPEREVVGRPRDEATCVRRDSALEGSAKRGTGDAVAETEERQEETRRERAKQKRSSAEARQYATAIMKSLKERSMGEDELFTSTLLTTIYDFEEGLEHVCEKQENFQLALSHFAEEDDVALLWKFCLANTSKNPALWIQALAFLASRDNTETQIQQILAQIEAHRLFPPLAVLDILQQGSRVTLRAVKGYLIHCLDKLSREFEISSSHYQQDEAEVESMKKEVQRLQTSGQIFDRTRCDACGNALDLPSVHFACCHSFHLVCLASGETDPSSAREMVPGTVVGPGKAPEYSCPVCTPQADAKRLLLAQREADSGRADDFFKFLRGSTDGFSFIASYFGKAMFPTLPADLSGAYASPLASSSSYEPRQSPAFSSSPFSGRPGGPRGQEAPWTPAGSGRLADDGMRQWNALSRSSGQSRGGATGGAGGSSRAARGASNPFGVYEDGGKCVERGPGDLGYNPFQA